MRRLKTGLLILFLLLIFFGKQAYAEETPPKAVIILIDQMNLEEINDLKLPAITRLIQEGGIALMNTNTAGGRTRGNGCVTIGAGRVAMGGPEAGLAFQTEENFGSSNAKDVFRGRTGIEASAGEAVHLGLAGILRANEGKYHTGIPGLLGETLHQAGLKTGLVGNADLDLTGDKQEDVDRSAAAIVMDRTGRVDFGIITGLTESCGGLLSQSTGIDQAAQAFSQIIEKADLVVVDTGDTVRLAKIKAAALDRVYEKERKDLLRKADLLVEKIITALEDYDGLVIITAAVPSGQAMREKNLVTPLIYWKKDGSSGFLISGTTRRQGIVANTDIAPTVLAHLGIGAPAEMSGRPMYTIKAGTSNPAAALLDMNKNLVSVNKARPPLVKAYILGQIAAVAATVISLFAGGRSVKHFPTVLLALSAVPLSFLIMGICPGLPFWFYALSAAFAAGAIAAFCLTGGRKHPLLPFLTVSLMTAGAILLDLSFGAPLMKNSVLGYDPMGGARYYGLGNEYMGVLIGALVIGTASLLQVLGPKKLVFGAISGAYLTVLLMIAAPGLGTNAGGTIAAGAAFGFSLYKIFPGEISKTRLVWAAAGALGILAAAACWDAFRSVEAQSHFGRTINLMRTNGLTEAYNIIVRKISLNLRLLRWTIWCQVFLVTFFGTALLFYRPVGLMKRVREKYPYLIKGFWGVVVGGVTALIFNDSGIVAAATMSIFAAGPLMNVVVKERTG